MDWAHLPYLGETIACLEREGLEKVNPRTPLNHRLGLELNVSRKGEA